MRYFFYSFVLFVMASPSNGSLSDDDPFEKAVATRLETHPELEAARLTIREAESRARAAGRLSDPELTGELAGGPDSEGRFEAGLSQKFPLTARLRHERDLQDLTIEAAREEVRQREVALARELRVTLHEWIEAQEQSKLQISRLENARQWLVHLESSSAGGESPAMDANAALVEIRRLQAELRRHEAAEAAVFGAAKVVWGDSPPAVRERPIPAGVSQNPPVGPQRRPDLLLARLALQASLVNTSLAKANGWEDIALGIFFEGERFRSGSGGFEPESLAGVRLSIPLPLWRDASAETEAREIAVHSRQLQLRNAEARAVREAEAAWNVLVARHRAVGSFQEAFQSASRQLDALHSSGPEIPRSRVFEQSALVHSLQSDLLKSRLDYHLARSDWLFAAGLTHHSNP